MKTFESLFAEIQTKASSQAVESNTRNLLEQGVHEIGPHLHAFSQKWKAHGCPPLLACTLDVERAFDTVNQDRCVCASTFYPYEFLHPFHAVLQVA